MSGDDQKEGTVPTAVTHLKSVPEPPGELESLFREHYDQVFRTAYRITGSAVDAEDVLQTVFLRLVRRKEGLDLAPSPGSYLHRAAINAALDLARSRGRLSSVPLDEIRPDLIASRELDPEAQHTDRELRRIVQRSVAQLGARAAEIFVLRYFEGYENREIAERLGMSQIVVAVTLHRARGRVRKEIGKFMEGSHETN